MQAGDAHLEFGRQIGRLRQQLGVHDRAIVVLLQQRHPLGIDRRRVHLAVVDAGFALAVIVALEAEIKFCTRELALVPQGTSGPGIGALAKAMGINTRNLKLLAFGMGATFGGVSGAMFAPFQGFVSPESFSLMESVMIVAMIVLGGLGHIPGVILGALLLSSLPEVLRYVAGPLQDMTGGRLDASILRQLLIALAMISVVLLKPKGLWPSPEHGKSLQNTPK